MSKGLNPRMKNLNDYFHMKYFGVFWWWRLLKVNLDESILLAYIILWWYFDIYSYDCILIRSVCLIVNKLEFNCLTEWAKNISYSSAIEPWANCLDRRLVKYLSGKVL